MSNIKNKFKYLLTELITICIILNSLSIAQSAKDSLGFAMNLFNRNSISTYFDKQLNTYNLNSLISYGAAFDKFFVGINERFVSTVNKTRAKNIKDEQYLSFLFEYEFLSNIFAGTFLRYNDYSDDRNIAINQSSLFNSFGYLKYLPGSNVYIQPYVGLSKNKQIGVLDDGLIYGVDGKALEFDLNQFTINADVKLQNEDILPRKNTDRLLKLNIKNNFENNFSNSIYGQYSKIRKDFYFEADSIISKTFNTENNIQSRIETAYFIEDKIQFNPSPSSFAFDLTAKASWRDIDRSTKYVSLQNVTSSTFDTQIEELKLDIATNVYYSTGIFNGVLRVFYSERDEKHNAKKIDGVNEIIYSRRQETELQKNNLSEQTTISLSGNLLLSKDDNLLFSIFHRKLQYDTPSKTNFDDRDELLSMFRVYYKRNLSPFFNLFLNLEGSINKIVYIFAERSSNNNIQRTLKFSSGGEYKGSIISSKNYAEVSANYTVYDYEDLNPNYKSFSFRQLALKDSSTIKLSRKIYLSFWGYLKLSEQGDFNWKNFAGKPVRFLEETYLEPLLQYRYYKIIFGFGLRYFSLLTYNYNSDNDKKLETIYRSVGPIAAIEYESLDFVNIKCSGWYELISNEKNKQRELANLFIQVSWNF